MLLNLMHPYPKFNNVANTTNTTPKFISNKGTGNKIINQINILTRVRLKPLTDGNIGIFASAYSSLRLIAKA